jgi:hypothetical protein
MRTFLLLTSVMLALPAVALAKGPSEASIAGPRIATITVSGAGEGLGGFGGLVEAAGFFPAMFTQVPDPMLSSRPRGNLGPRYTITWVVPGPNGTRSRIAQDVYPYTKPYAVTYMKPGQHFFEQDQTHGGWYVSDAALKQRLVAAGLPARPSTGGGSGLSTGDLAGVALAGAAALALTVLTATRIRRRPRTLVST